AAQPDMLNRELCLAILNQRLDLLRGAGVPMHPQDARDYSALSRLLSRIAPHVIVHLAAVSHAGRANKDPYSTFDHSLRTLENALAGLKLRVDGDGGERLDFTYIDDLVQGISLAIQNPAAHNQIFNMTYGRGRAIHELVEIMREEFPSLEVEYVDRDNLMPVR